ncbi:MAG: hypothetical protein HKN10_11710 [Myxococcales bacterium]|nr:hypothetical protein [Deltaproteobacteria bacterium]NNE19131.1 hypothetical protein [Myxococcales bacterium]
MNQSSTRQAPKVGFRSVLAILGSSKLLFFAAAFLSYLLSIWLWFSGDRERGLFVGLWVPSILSAGALLLSRGHHE